MIELIHEPELMPCHEDARFVLVLCRHDLLERRREAEREAAREIQSEGDVALCPIAQAYLEGYSGYAASLRAGWLAHTLVRRCQSVRVYHERDAKADPMVLSILRLARELGGSVDLRQADELETRRVG